MNPCPESTVSPDSAVETQTTDPEKAVEPVENPFELTGGKEQGGCTPGDCGPLSSTSK